MSTAKHTPGPWRVATGTYGSWIVESDDVPVTAAVGQRRICALDNKESSETNARLIAAAPDLLAALHTVLDSVDYTASACGLTEMVGAALPKEVIAKARAAIAKAKGLK